MHINHEIVYKAVAFSVKDNLISSLKINQFIHLLLKYSQSSHTTFFSFKKSQHFAQSIFMQYMTLKLKSNYFPKKYEMADVCNAHVVFYLWGRNNNFKDNSDELHF